MLVGLIGCGALRRRASGARRHRESRAAGRFRI
jgi:hypothetical protein